MSQIASNQIIQTEAKKSQWHDLFNIASLSSLLMVVLIPLQVFVFINWQIPETAIESFTLFQENKLYGLLAFELLYLISNVLSISLYLGLFIALRRVNQTVMVIATILGLISIALIFAARPTFDMLYLSDQFAAASTEVQRALYLAAGEAKLALIYGTAQQVHYVLGSVALLLISIVMLWSDVFSKATAYTGILANIIVFGLYMPTIGVYLSIISVFPFLTLWLILTARQLWKLGHPEKKSEAFTAKARSEI